MRVAFLGLGLMGAPMALCLHAAGFDVTGWNRSRAKADALAGSGVTIAPSAAEAVAGTTTICLCLTDATAVQAVLAGLQFAPTSIVVDFSSLGVDDTRRIAADLKSRTGADWIDAPVSGGVGGAQRGDLTIFCGGDAAAIERAMPVLRAVGRRISHLGATGAGQAAKLCNQLIVSSNLLAIAEAVVLAKSLGLDAQMMVEALLGGFADSGPLRVFGPRMARTDEQPLAGAIATMAKDVAAVTAASHRTDAKLALQAETGRLYQRALDQGLGDRDLGRLIELYETVGRPADRS